MHQFVSQTNFGATQFILPCTLHSTLHSTWFCSNCLTKESFLKPQHWLLCLTSAKNHCHWTVEEAWLNDSYFKLFGQMAEFICEGDSMRLWMHTVSRSVVQSGGSSVKVWGVCTERPLLKKEAYLDRYDKSCLWPLWSFFMPIMLPDMELVS